MTTLRRVLAVTAAAALVTVGIVPAVTVAAPAAASFSYPDDYVENGVTEAPLLGWSSWSLQATSKSGYNTVDGTSYSYSWLTAAHIEAAADVMASTLKSHGYEYVNIDAGWWREWDWTPEYDEYGRYAVDASRFPDGIQTVIDYIHNLGLKVGIYVPVGMEIGAYGDGTTAIAGSDSCTTGDAVYSDLRYTNGWDSSYALDFTNANGCAQAWIDSLTSQYADWGIDFLKIDGVGYGSGRSATTDERYDNRADIAAWNLGFTKAGRDVTIAISWALDQSYVSDWQQLADSWRISTDIECYCSTLVKWYTSSGGSIWSRFSQSATWADDAGWDAGWNDLDSLDVGDPKSISGLSEDERRSAMTLWAISAAPLYSGDDLTQLDTFGINLLTNDEVIAIDQAGVPAQPLGSATDQEQIWTSQIDGSYIVAMFNTSDATDTMSIDFASDLGLNHGGTVRDVWAGEDLGSATSISVSIVNHGVRLFKVTPVDALETTTTLSADTARQSYGSDDTITLTARVAGSDGSSPEGTVTFRTADGAFGAATVVDGVASVTLPADFEVGSYTAYADFEPADAEQYGASESSTLTFKVLQAASTIAAAVPSITAGEDATASVRVSATGAVPTGAVTLTWTSSAGASGTTTATLSGGAASATLSGLAAGAYTLQAGYAGDTEVSGSTTLTAFSVSPASASPAAASSRSTLTVSKHTVKKGKKITATVKVTASGTTPTGRVRIYDGGTLLKTVTLAKGKASAKLKLSRVGTHRLRAVYVGSTGVSSSTSTKVTVKVKKR
ncbi:MAG: Ig-like domain repeat protein [Microbacteriaceae bacterium]